MLRLNKVPCLWFKEVVKDIELVTITRSSSSSTTPLDGKNATAVILGGFGSRERQMKRHSELYNKHNFNVMPVMSGMLELTTPEVASVRGKTLAKKLQNADKPIVIHTISASFWTVIYMLENMDKSWRDKRVKAIVFDSCPAESDIQAFGGWMSVRLEQTSLKPILSHFFHPFLSFCGITDDWRAQNHMKMFGENSVIPRNASILFIYGLNDPVLNRMYLKSFIDDVKANKSPYASVTEKQFEQSIHALSIREHEEEYQQAHEDELLAKVSNWAN